MFLRSEPLYEFDRLEDEEAFHRLLSRLHCPQCEAQSLAESPSPIAQSLRQQIYAMFKAGKSSQEVSAYLRQRYGEEVLMMPVAVEHRIFLWGLPLFFLLAIGVYLYRRHLVR